MLFCIKIRYSFIKPVFVRHLDICQPPIHTCQGVGELVHNYLKFPLSWPFLFINVEKHKELRIWLTFSRRHKHTVIFIAIYTITLSFSICMTYAHCFFNEQKGFLRTCLSLETWKLQNHTQFDHLILLLGNSLHNWCEYNNLILTIWSTTSASALRVPVTKYVFFMCHFYHPPMMNPLHMQKQFIFKPAICIISNTPWSFSSARRIAKISSKTCLALTICPTNNMSNIFQNQMLALPLKTHSQYDDRAIPHHCFQIQVPD